MLRQALHAALPIWLAVCAIAVLFGWMMSFFPGALESPQFYPQTWAGNLAHYDPHSYVLIAQQGYGAEGRDFQSSVRFPLFPFFTRLAMQVFALDPYVALFILSKAALLVGLVGVWLLAAHWEAPAQANRALVYVAFPLLGSGYTWLMSYPDALHLALWTFGFWLLLRRRYDLAGLVTVLCVWTRPHAVIILPVFAFVLVSDAVRERGWRSLMEPALWWRGLLTCGLPLLAFGAWLLHISRLTEIPLSPITAQAAYGRGELLSPLARVVEFLSLPWARPFNLWTGSMVINYYQVLLIIVSLVILGAAAVRRRLAWGMVVFSLLSLLPGLSTEIYAVARFALLTWIPVALMYIVPPRYDLPVMAFAVAFNFLTVVVVNLTGGLTL
jgi:hypothetical protein